MEVQRLELSDQLLELPQSGDSVAQSLEGGLELCEALRRLFEEPLHVLIRGQQRREGASHCRVESRQHVALIADSLQKLLTVDIALSGLDDRTQQQYQLLRQYWPEIIAAHSRLSP